MDPLKEAERELARLRGHLEWIMKDAANADTSRPDHMADTLRDCHDRAELALKTHQEASETIGLLS